MLEETWIKEPWQISALLGFLIFLNKLLNLLNKKGEEKEDKEIWDKQKTNSMMAHLNHKMHISM